MGGQALDWFGFSSASFPEKKDGMHTSMPTKRHTIDSPQSTMSNGINERNEFVYWVLLSLSTILVTLPERSCWKQMHAQHAEQLPSSYDCRPPKNLTLNDGEVVIGVFSGFDKRAKAQLDGWVRLANQYNISVLFFTQGGANRTVPLRSYGLGRCVSIMKNGLHCQTSQGTQNTLYMYDIVREQYPRYKLYMKTDDDTFIHIIRLLYIIRDWIDMSRGRFIIGQYEDSHRKTPTNPNANPRNPFRYYCGGGAGMILTRAIADELAWNGFKKCSKMVRWPSDVFVSQCALHHLGASLKYHNGFNAENGNDCFIRKNCVTQHHIPPHKMLELFDANGRQCLRSA